MTTGDCVDNGFRPVMFCLMAACRTRCLGLRENQSQIQMISLSQQLKSWRSRYCLSKHEAAEALGVTNGTIEAIERGTEVLRGRERQALLDKLSRSPHPDIKGPTPDAGYRPGNC